MNRLGCAIHVTRGLIPRSCDRGIIREERVGKCHAKTIVTEPLPPGGTVMRLLTAPCTAVGEIATCDSASPAAAVNCDQIPRSVVAVIVDDLAPFVEGACNAKFPTCSLRAPTVGLCGLLEASHTELVQKGHTTE